MCGGFHLPNLTDTGPWDDLINNLAEQLFNERYEKGYIPPELYRRTVDQLLKAMHDGLGGSSFGIDDSRNTLKAYLSQNLYVFSAAKSLTEMQHFNELLRQADGNFISFRNAVTTAGYQFNINYLRTEFDTANASAQMAQQWQYLSASSDYLQFTTVGDDRVRPTHARLDGLTLRKDSPVWKKMWPPLDWNCRCHVVPGIAAKATTDQEAGSMAKQAVINPLFDFNPGIAKTIFKDAHPYFDYAGSAKAFDAVKNYGLKTIEKLYDDHEFPPRINLTNEADYKAWWQRQPKYPGTDDIVLKDQTGLFVKFDSVESPRNSGSPDSYFKDHILRKAGENRWQYAANFPDIIADPDEIWSQREGNKLKRGYIKYYEDAAYLVMTMDKNDILTAETIYRLTPSSAMQIRKGALIFTKK